MVPSKMTVKPAIDCGVPFFPFDFFNQSPMLQLVPAKNVLPATQPASDDILPANGVNPPRSEFLYSNLNPPTLTSQHARGPTPIDCCVPAAPELVPTKMLPPTQPASNDPPSNDAVFHHVKQSTCWFLFSVDESNYSINPDIPTRPTPIHCCAPMNLYPLPLNPPLPLHPTEVDCCVPPLPDSPNFKLPLNACHEYIKRKILQHGIGWTRTTYLQVL
jgi:hypothetical protein